MKTLVELKSALDDIEKILGYSFEDKNLLLLAFSHRSFVNEHPDLIGQDNQRLEFLGDAVLGLIVADFIYASFPQDSEGKLSPLKASLVEATACVKYLKKLRLENFLLLGKGELKSEGRGRDSLFADLFEALIGAIYLDGGLKAVDVFIETKLSEIIDEILSSPSSNYKALLQIHLQKKGLPSPIYLVVKEWGPAHQKTFHVAVSIEDKILGEGEGFSKKLAEMHAAKEAYDKMIQEEKDE